MGALYNVKNKKKVYLVLLVISILMCAFFKLTTRERHFEDEIEKGDLIMIPSVPSRFYKSDIGEATISTDFEQYVDNLNTFDDLVNHSELIIIGKLKSRKQLGNVVNSDIEIQKVISGNVETKEISVFEPYFIDPDDKQIHLKETYVPMEFDKTYILFLNKQPLYENGTQYNLTSLYYGKYVNNDKLKIIKLDANQKYMFSEIKDYDFLSISTDDDKNSYLNDKESDQQFIKEGLENIKKYEEYRDNKYIDFHKDAMKLIK